MHLFSLLCTVEMFLRDSGAKYKYTHLLTYLLTYNLHTVLVTKVYSLENVVTSAFTK